MMERRATTKIGRWTLALAAAALTVSADPVGAQQGLDLSRDCRCVDRQGREIDDCTCFRTPEVLGRAGLGMVNRARIGITVGSDLAPGDDREGVPILDVLEGGPADQAGLQQGDLITRVGGKSLFEPLEDEQAEARIDLDHSVPAQRLVALLGKLGPGDEVEIEYVRDGDTSTVTVTAQRNPPFSMAEPMMGSMRWRDAMPGLVPRGDLHFEVPRPLGEARRSLILPTDPCFGGSDRPVGAAFLVGHCIDGVDLVALNSELATYFGTDEGVLVTNVREESKLGLLPGDVILSVDGREVSTPEDVVRIVESYELDEELTLHVVRRGEQTEIVGRRR